MRNFYSLSSTEDTLLLDIRNVFNLATTINKVNIKRLVRSFNRSKVKILLFFYIFRFDLYNTLFWYFCKFLIPSTVLFWYYCNNIKIYKKDLYTLALSV